MGRYLHIILCLILLGIALSDPSSASTVTVDIIHSQDRYQAGGSYPILLRLSILEPWYIHGPNKESEYLIPTTLSFENSPDLKIENIRFPEPIKEDFEYTPDPIEVYSGDIYVKSILNIGDNTPEGKFTIKGILSFQACTLNRCLPVEDITLKITLLVVQDQNTPVAKLNRDLFIAASSRQENPTTSPLDKHGSGLWFTLMGFFLAGMGLNLTPCVYPLIPITISYFAGRGKKEKGSILLSGILFMLGIAITNSSLGFAAALSGNILGSALQSPIVLIFVSCVLIILALSFFGLWELHIPNSLQIVASRNYKGYFGTFFMGLTLGIVAAPCVGPFILGLITYVAYKAEPITGFLYFFVLSIGMGIPLVILAIFSGAIEKLPISGDWMVWIKKFLGWILLAMAAYMINPLIHIPSVRIWIICSIAIAAGIHLAWIDKTGIKLQRFLSFKKIVGILLVCGGLVYLLTAPDNREGIKWLPYNRELVFGAIRDNKPLILDFYADWCAPCRQMEKTIFKDPEIVELSRNFVSMRIDLTKSSPSHDVLLHQYNIIGVPTIIFMNKEGKEVEGSRIIGLTDKNRFMKSMMQVL